MKAKKRSLKDRAVLALSILNCVQEHTESFRCGSVGADLAYLVSAVLSNGYVQVNAIDETHGFVEVLNALEANELLEDVEPYLERT